MLLLVVFCRKKSKSFEAALAAAAGLAAVLWLLAYQYLWIMPLHQWNDVEGTIVATVETVQPGYSEERARVVLSIEKIDGRSVSFRAFCDDYPLVKAGDRVSAKAAFYHYTNQRDQRLHYADGVFIGVECTEETWLEENRFLLNAWFDEQRGKASALLQRAMPGENGEMMAAIITGDAAAVQKETRLRFQKAGVSHMLVVSGLHLSITALSAFSLLKKALGKRRRAAGIALVLLLGYMLFTGMTASVIRAGIMAGFILIGELFRKKSDSLTSLGAAALALVLINPYAASDAGVLFSFSATLGVLFAGHFTKYLRRTWRTGWRKKLVPVCAAAAVPVCAMLFTLPVQIWVGGTVSPFGILANLLLVPALQPLLLLGMLLMLLLPFSGLAFFTGFFVFLTEWLLLYLKQVVIFIASIPFGRIGLSGWFALVVCLVIFSAGAFLWKKGKHRAAAGMACTLFAAACLLCVPLTRGTVTIAEIGYGKNPAVVLMQDSCAAVFYRGGDSNAYAVQRYLESRGIDQISYLVNMEKRSRQNLFMKEFGREADINLREETFFSETKPLFHDIILKMERHPSGSVCRIEIEGYSVVVTAGGVDLRGWPKATVLLPGSGKIVGARYDAVVCTRALPAWLMQGSGEIYVEQDTPELFIRPGKSLYIRQGG